MCRIHAPHALDRLHLRLNCSEEIQSGAPEAVCVEAASTDAVHNVPHSHLNKKNSLSWESTCAQTVL